MAKLKISDKAKKIINNGKDLINNDKFQEFFDGIYSLTSNRGIKGEIGYVFYKTFGTEFLEYMNTITDGMFFCSNIGPYIKIPSTITEIGAWAFADCDNLKSIEIPNITYIGNDAFWNCKNLQSISLPKVEEIGEVAITDCTSLTSVSIPNVKIIHRTAFGGCPKLKSIIVPKDFTDEQVKSGGIDLNKVEVIRK